MMATSFLQQFVGEYELSEQIIKIYLRENDLVASLPGQPDYELVPDKDMEFNVKNLPGFSMKFIRDNSGIVTQAEITQPRGIFTANKK